MSYEIKVGKAAEEQINQEKKDYSKILKKFKSGTNLKVKIPNGESFAQYFSHSVFGKFYTTVHTDGDLYCKASSYYYAEAKKLEDNEGNPLPGNEKAHEELRNHGYNLKKKERYMLGFFGLDDGEEFLIDLTRKQAKTVIAQIKKYVGKYEKFAFELSKTGKGQDTVVSLDPVIDFDDLTKDEQKNFNKVIESKKQLDLSVFGKVFAVREEADQVEDLKKYGFDVALLDKKDEVVFEENDLEEKHNF